MPRTTLRARATGALASWLRSRPVVGKPVHPHRERLRSKGMGSSSGLHVPGKAPTRRERRPGVVVLPLSAPLGRRGRSLARAGDDTSSRPDRAGRESCESSSRAHWLRFLGRGTLRRVLPDCVRPGAPRRVPVRAPLSTLDPRCLLQRVRDAPGGAPNRSGPRAHARSSPHEIHDRVDGHRRAQAQDVPPVWLEAARYPGIALPVLRISARDRGGSQAPRKRQREPDRARSRAR